MCRSRRELSNAYLLAKFGFDTVNHLFVPLRYLQFLKIVRSTAAAAAAENEPCKVCPLSAYRSPQVLATSVALSNGGERRHILRLGQPELLHQGQLPARAAGEASGSADGGRPGHVQSFGYLAADFGVKKNPTFIFISPRAKIPKYRQNIKIPMYFDISNFVLAKFAKFREIS